MIENVNKIKVLEEFLKDTLKGFSIREISRRINLAYPSVRNYIKELEKEGFILKKKKYGRFFYFANRENKKFRNFKIYYNIDQLYSSGLIDYMNKKLGYPTIILYGSFAKGEDVRESDIDMVVIEKKINLNLEIYEKKLKHPIHVLFFKSLKDVHNEELKLNIINGIVLEGEIDEI